MFSVALACTRCVDLCNESYAPFRAQLQSVESYAFTHRVGEATRDAGAAMLLFPSARGPGDNVAVFDETIFSSRPFDQEAWTSQTRSDTVMFRGPEGVFQLPLQHFADEQGQFLRIAA